MDNREIIEKTFDMEKLEYAGELNPEQQDQLVVLVKKFSMLLQHVRFVRMTQSKDTVDKMHISEPITESIEEDTTSPNLAIGQFNKIELVAKKLRTAWNITTEVLRNNIERAKFEDTLMESLSARMTTDYEMLAIQGDITIVAATPAGRLLRRLNGWDKLTEDSHKVYVNSQPISFGVFNKMWRTMPSQYRNDPMLRWILSDIIANDWTNALAQRTTNAGDQAIGGNPLKPLGKPMISVPLVPSDKPINLDTGIPGEVVGTRYGPFKVVTGTNDSFVYNIDSDAGGPYTLTLPAGVHDTVAIANLMNQDFATNTLDAIAYDDGDGKIAIRSDGAAAANNVIIGAGSTCLDLFGLTAGTYSGQDTGSVGSLREGSFIWLTNPKNFVFGLVDGTRFYSRFNPDYDRQEARVFTEVAVEVENDDAVVKAVDVRRQPL